MTLDTVRLHVPDEPLAWRHHWWDLVAEGRDFEELLTDEQGLACWLWRRWRAVRGAGMGREDFFEIVVGYRRELWFWLVGERTWPQACAGLVGRVQRRLPSQEELETHLRVAEAG